MAEEQTTSTSSENQELQLSGELKIDFTYDYSEDIKADVDNVVLNSESLQEELTNIEKITQKYTPLAESAQTQSEMNVASQWLYTIWDTELNNLWSRFSNSADQQAKENLLAEQRNLWIIREQVKYIVICLPDRTGKEKMKR